MNSFAKTIQFAILILTFLIPLNAFSWDGTDTDNGDSVTIGKGQLVRRGKDIELYNNDTGEYISGEVESIRRNGRYVEIELYEYSSGETKIFEMEDN